MEEKTKKQKISYLVLAAVLTIVVGIGGVYAYFSASVNGSGDTITGTTEKISNSDLSLAVSKINFTGATANGNLVPAYFGTHIDPRAGTSRLNVTTPADLTQTNVTNMISNKCEMNGYTGCHVYSITFSSTKEVPSANLLLNLSVSNATADKSQWGYALFTEDGNVTNHETTNLALLTGNRVPAPIGNGVNGLDIHNGQGLSAGTSVVYYLLVYVNDTNEVQNASDTSNVIGTYNGSLTLQVMGGQVRADFSPQAPVTPITDFEYTIGGNGDFASEPTYIGTNPIVNIPSSYTIGNAQYTPVIYVEETGDGSSGTFYGNTLITDVTLSNDILIGYMSNDDREPTFTYNDARYAFYNCTSLVNAPEIPSSVTNMGLTFSGCTSLVNAPTIPSSVINMGSTFSGCTSLVNAPAIPSSVTNMSSTFQGCTNLEGTVRVNSFIVSNAYAIFQNTIDTFNGTIKNIYLDVPANSTTYNTFNNGTLPANVTLTTH